jgi:predicted aspartyl protease
MSIVLALCLQAALLGAEVSTPPFTSPTDAPPAAEETEPLFASPTRLDRIGRVMAPVIINGRGPYRLVVDTGASHSTFSPNLVSALGLSPSFEATMQLNGVTGVAPVPTVMIDTIQAGDLVLKDVQVPVVWSSIMANADGILGVAGLRKERILVDFRRDRIVISRSSTRVDTDGFFRIPARLVAGGLLMVDARVGGVPVRAVIDTGAERTLGNAALRDRLRTRGRRADLQWSTTEVFGATIDVAQGQTAIAPAIKIGPITIKRTEIVYGDFHIFKVWQLDKRPALLIGMDVLGTVDALVVDYSRRRLYVDVRGSGIARRDMHSIGTKLASTESAEHRELQPPTLEARVARIVRTM